MSLAGYSSFPARAYPGARSTPAESSGRCCRFKPAEPCSGQPRRLGGAMETEPRGRLRAAPLCVSLASTSRQASRASSLAAELREAVPQASSRPRPGPCTGAWRPPRRSAAASSRRPATMAMRPSRNSALRMLDARRASINPMRASRSGFLVPAQRQECRGAGEVNLAPIHPGHARGSPRSPGRRAPPPRPVCARIHAR